MTCGTPDERRTSNGAERRRDDRGRDVARRADRDAQLDGVTRRRRVRRVSDDRELRDERERADHQSFPPGGGSTLVLLLLLGLHVALLARRAAKQLFGLLLAESALRLRRLSLGRLVRAASAATTAAAAPLCFLRSASS